MASPPSFSTLPLFRKDLKIYPGPPERDGSPTYNLLDPLKGQYYKINWKESFLFRYLKPGMSAQDLADKIESVSCLKVTAEEIEGFFQQAHMLDLVRLPKSSEYLTAVHQRKQHGFWLWLLYHYLYIRIPLLNPDRFLTRTLYYVTPFFSKWAFAIYTFISCIGLLIVLDQKDAFFHTFTYFFTLQGLLFYAIAISTVKLIHEFSHAYVAKFYGLHVPTMGVALIVLWPVLYTDVTDGWKLSNRSQRFAVSFAGIAAELIVAGLSTLGWALSEPGLSKSIFFVLASTSWVSTFLINANPAVRFDGYYMLCDLWGIDNLQPRAFAMATWKYRQWLFGIKMPPPEEGLSPSLTAGMVIYSFYTWIYRILLYTTIAIFVYFEFTKALGILLFLAEILIFFVWPIVYEAKQLYMIRSLFHRNPRLLFTLTVAGLFAAWFILPLPHRVSFDAVVIPRQYQIIYAPEEGLIKALYVKRGQDVLQGQPLVELESKALLKDLTTARLNKELIEKQLLIIQMGEGLENYMAPKQAELAQINASFAILQKRLNQLTLRANISGTLAAWDETLKTGVFIPKGHVFGKIADLKQWIVLAYVPDTLVSALQTGQSASVEISSPPMYFQGTVLQIEPFRSEFLKYLSLASTNFGPLPAVEYLPGQEPALLQSYYIAFLSIQIDNPELLHDGQLASVRVRGPWRSKLVQFLETFQRLFLRESSL